MLTGCVDEFDDSGSTAMLDAATEEASAFDGAQLPAEALTFEAAPASALNAFDFDTGNAPIEVVIPAIVPVIFANVTPGDAVRRPEQPWA